MTVTERVLAYARRLRCGLSTAQVARGTRIPIDTVRRSILRLRKQGDMRVARWTTPRIYIYMKRR